MLGQVPLGLNRMLRRMLMRQGVHVGRRHLGTLMAGMGIQALCLDYNASAAGWQNGTLYGEWREQLGMVSGQGSRKAGAPPERAQAA